MGPAIRKNFPHVGLMHNLKNWFRVDPHQSKGTVGQIEQIHQGIHLPHQRVLRMPFLFDLSSSLVQVLMKLVNDPIKVAFPSHRRL